MVRDVRDVVDTTLNPGLASVVATMAWYEYRITVQCCSLHLRHELSTSSNKHTQGVVPGEEESVIAMSSM